MIGKSNCISFNGAVAEIIENTTQPILIDYIPTIVAVYCLENSVGHMVWGAGCCYVGVVDTALPDSIMISEVKNATVFYTVDLIEGDKVPYIWVYSTVSKQLCPYDAQTIYSSLWKQTSLENIKTLLIYKEKEN